MIRTSGTIRRATLTVAMAGAATFGAVALAPAASAAPAAAPSVDGAAYVIDGNGGGGPVAFLVTERGRKAIFYIDPAKPNKRHNVAQQDPTAGGGDRL